MSTRARIRWILTRRQSHRVVREDSDGRRGPVLLAATKRRPHYGEPGPRAQAAPNEATVTT